MSLSNPYLSVLIFAAVGAVFVAAQFILQAIVSSHKPNAVKNMSYECGEEPIGPAWIQYNVRYYIFALVFVIFDVEVVYLIPWAVVFRQIPVASFWEMAVFIAFLLFGLAYVWKKGDLKWY